ncbi:MAG TPA: MgtC/SapB family protein [Steroidobacteraceae bacterium]|nr:MgtC/SapB family protein [Steroidobacteraceae bacterium]
MNSVTHELTRSIPDLADLVRILGRLTVAMIIGAAIGVQRHVSHKAAGVRTHMLVALGTALLVVTASDAGLSNSDLSRIVQGIITGIGFLGGGAILKLTQEQEIRGLTTAAGIWLTAAASAAAGLGQVAAALIGLLFALIVLAVMKEMDPPSQTRSPPPDTPEK